ncbi:MAG: AraC family transcriptional regulator [Bacteroidia bacterium]|nr:AraC family transcriptional regulator [Bacteroidia bacterium]
MDQNFIDKILLIGSTLAFFLAILLLKKKGKALHDYFISAWLIFLGLYVTVYSFSPAYFFINNPWLINFYISILFLNGPFLFVYIKALTNSDYKFDKSILWHLLPFIIFNLYLIFFFPSESILKNACSVHGSSKLELPLPYFIFLIIIAFSVPFYIFWSISILRKHRKIISDNFSAIEKRTLTWLRNLISILGIVWIILTSIIFIHHVLLLFSDSFCINGLFMTLTAFIVMVGYFGLNQPAIFTSQNISIPIDIIKSDKPYSGSSLKDDYIQQYLAILEEHMKSKKPYLNNQLTLSQLATEINILPHHLSRIINENYKLNFFDFVNQYRVEAFKEKVINPKFENLSFLGLALECGFNSKSTFNRIFKNATGLTPSQYKNTFF